MKTSYLGISEIRKREGCVLHWYKDSVGIWTCCVGHTGRATPPTYKEGQTFTLADADAILAGDLLPFETAVNHAITRPMTQNQFDACVSLAFNIGAGAFSSSSVVRKFNAGDVTGAAQAFLLWDKAGGSIVPGLATRRKAERDQFLAKDAPAVMSPGPVAIHPLPTAKPEEHKGFWVSLWEAIKGKMPEPKE